MEGHLEKEKEKLLKDLKKTPKVAKQVINYPKAISDCAKGPSKGGLSIKDLRKLATDMGIKVKGLNKDAICSEIKKLVG